MFYKPVTGSGIGLFVLALAMVFVFGPTVVNADDERKNEYGSSMSRSTTGGDLGAGTNLKDADKGSYGSQSGSTYNQNQTDSTQSYGAQGSFRGDLDVGQKSDSYSTDKNASKTDTYSHDKDKGFSGDNTYNKDYDRDDAHSKDYDRSGAYNKSDEQKHSNSGKDYDSGYGNQDNRMNRDEDRSDSGYQNRNTDVQKGFSSEDHGDKEYDKAAPGERSDKDSSGRSDDNKDQDKGGFFDFLRR